MAPVKNVTISNGSVTYHDEVEAGLVEFESAPAFFEASFMLDAESEAGGLKVRNIFHLRTRVAGLPADTPYAEVEARAFEQLAPMLADLARQIDAGRGKA